MKMFEKCKNKLPSKDIAGTDKDEILNEALKLVLHESVIALVRPFGSWTVESFHDILKI